MTLKVEDERPILRPTLAQLHSAIDRTKPTGPAFVIVRQGNGNYAQAGGGNGIFSVEWREYGEPFVHLIAGKGEPVEEEIIVQMHYGFTRICRHEVLSTNDVKVLLGAFLIHGRKPDGYVWRDVSYAFRNVPAWNNGVFREP